ncbi:NAD-dependent succinate-semialdehyde dehydrogenase [Alkalicoccus halolimnae]|uniref:Aldehyde dehydrogenase n=1 Tax=Alkalicoccus halolimnae TaxID=1667239 RepID=A0A5C7F8D2_9BACI|nr:NAD-dependent succinate-semialdehyde dehydrogenase [Alkalicoccus halolimnae]TXF85638.1 NAD-dependent succinate-semialdehyde dehydrogenase [Alkalicoccus halolimnae]
MQLTINDKAYTSSKTINVLNPLTQEVVAEVPFGGREEAEAAVKAASEAYVPWSRKTADARADLMMKWHDNLLEEEDKIAEVMTKEQGKPFKEAKGEVRYAASFIRWYAEEARRIKGETIPASSADKKIVIQPQPIGVVAAITPWNFPAAMITRKAAPALAAGCTIVIKPAEQTPLTAWLLKEAADKAGIPSGVIEVVVGEPAVIGETWMKSPLVKKVTFTGSTPVGKLLMSQAAETVKKVSLELGGNAPFIVFKDANLEKAVQGVIQSKFRNAGQTCVCTNRVYVQEEIMEAFTQKLKEKVEGLLVGDGFEENTDIGPLINEEALVKTEKHIEQALKEGASLVTGGARLTEGSPLFKPTVLSGVTDNMSCMQQETFAPLAPIAAFKNEEEVITRANQSPFGLAAYIFTESLSTAWRTAEALEYGIVGINDGLPSAAQAPFGGMKESGIGREGGTEGLYEFLETKYMSFSI